jgi:hypothetical protein
MGNVEQGAIRRQAVVHDRQTVVKAFASDLDDTQTGERKTTRKPDW